MFKTSVMKSSYPYSRGFTVYRKVTLCMHGTSQRSLIHSLIDGTSDGNTEPYFLPNDQRDQAKKISSNSAEIPVIYSMCFLSIFRPKVRILFLWQEVIPLNRLHAIKIPDKFYRPLKTFTTDQYELKLP